MQHLEIPLEDLHPRNSMSSAGSEHSETDGILGVYSAADQSVLSDWLAAPSPNSSRPNLELESAADFDQLSMNSRPSNLVLRPPSPSSATLHHRTRTPSPIRHSVANDSPLPPQPVRKPQSFPFQGTALQFDAPDNYAISTRSSIVSQLGPRPLGRSCFYFGSDNNLRQNLFWLHQNSWYYYTRIALTLLQVAILQYETIIGQNIPSGHGFLHRWQNVTILLLYILWTFHVISHIIAFGGFTYQVITWDSVKSTVLQKIRVTRKMVLDSAEVIDQVSIHDDMEEVEQVLAKDREQQLQDELQYDQPFFRKSWNRVEFFSVFCYWLGMPATAAVDNVPLIWQMFYGLSYLRIFWLLSVWHGTEVIFHSLKIAFPLLSDVFIFIALSMVAFSVAGLQSFSGSLSRNCVWVDPTGQSDNYTTSQSCGSYLHAVTNELMPYITEFGESSGVIKGYACPQNSYCIEGQSEYDGTLSFDNIFNALEIVFVVMSNNTYSDIMYAIIAAEQAASSLYFIGGVVVLNYWMLSLLVSVLSSSFDIAWEARPKTKEFKQLASFKRFFRTGDNFAKAVSNSRLGRFYTGLYPLFAVLIFLDVCFQAAWSPDDANRSLNHFLFTWEKALSFLLLAEVFFRLALYTPRWRRFFQWVPNIIDLVLGFINVGTIYIYYSHPGRYAWLTFFQLIRFYRFVMLFPVAERMFKMIFGNFEQLWKLTIFYFFITWGASMIACRMYIGQLPYTDPSSGDTANVSFFNLANSFFGMYQISSTENWTDVLYYAVEYSQSTVSRAFGAAMFCIWLAFSNFIVVNLFISVMTGGFAISLTNKRQEQVRRFVKRSLSRAGRVRDPSRWNEVRPVLTRVLRELLLGRRPQLNRKQRIENPLNAIGQVAEKELLEEFLKLNEAEIKQEDEKIPTLYSHLSDTVAVQVFLKVLRSLLEVFDREHNYQRHVTRKARMRQRVERSSRFAQWSAKIVRKHHRNSSEAASKSSVSSVESTEDVGRQVTFDTAPEFVDDRREVREGSPESAETARTDYANDEDVELPLPRRNDHTRDYLDSLFTEHARVETQNLERSQESPYYERSLYIFSSNSKIRRFCQHIVPSNHGSRVSGVEPNHYVWSTFWLITLNISIAVVVVSCINTPIYHIQHTQARELSVYSWTWITYLDLIFTILFLIEFLIKVIADGFHFSPNAYTYSPWNIIDFIVLLSMISTVVNNILAGPISRYSRAIMAFRALRLIATSPESEQVFTAMFFSGIGRIVVAAFIGLGVVFPYSVWGLNIFHDQLSYCADGDINELAQCYNEFQATPFNWDVWSPRYVTKPYFDYDSFGQAMLVQFGVLSLEGWVDVLNAVTSIQGVGLSANVAFNKNFYALYPILYNFIGTVLIMTMFLSTIIRNYSITRVTAFLTSEQLTWHYMKRTLRELKPKMQLPLYPPGTLRQKMLDEITNPTSTFNIFEGVLIAAMTLIYFVFHETMSFGQERAYFIVVAVLALVYVAFMNIKLWILRWRVFISDRWNLFALIVTYVLAASTLYTINNVGGFGVGFQRAATLLSLVFWIPKIPPVRRLFRTASVNRTEVGTILNTYFILFLTFAIAFNQTFGITKLGESGSPRQNFRSVPKALILLFKMSTGEGWNQILVDYTLGSPYCTAGRMFFESDCGSRPAATILFIAWNIISMYVFANLFISVIYDTFWYLYRRTQISITNYDLLTFQKNWQLYDPQSKGSLLVSDFYNFLRTSSGYFKIGIYSDDPDYNLQTIIERSGMRKSYVNRYDVDYEALNRYLAVMPVEKFRQKRTLYELFCQQALQSMETGGTKEKIKFQSLLLQFPLYKDMDPSKVMELTEFIDLKVELYQIKLVLATNFIIRRWRLRNNQYSDVPTARDSAATLSRTSSSSSSEV